MYGIQLPSGVPAQDPANGTNLTVSNSGQLQLSIGGAAPSPVAAGQVDPGQRITVANDGDPVSFTGLDGAAAGGYYLEGLWITPGATDGNLAIQINSETSGYTGGTLVFIGSSSSNTNQTQDPGGGSVTTGVLLGRTGLSASGRDRLFFRAWISPGDGTQGVVFVTVSGEAYLNSDKSNFESFRVTAVVPISGKITRLDVVPTSGVAADLKAGTFARLQKTGLTA